MRFKLNGYTYGRTIEYTSYFSYDFCPVHFMSSFHFNRKIRKWKNGQQDWFCVCENGTILASLELHYRKLEDKGIEVGF